MKPVYSVMRCKLKKLLSITAQTDLNLFRGKYKREIEKRIKWQCRIEWIFQVAFHTSTS